MIYLRLHQARNEEIDRGASRNKEQAGNFAIVVKFLCNSESFAIVACSETLCSLFLCTNDCVLVNFISTLNVIILFR